MASGPSSRPVITTYQNQLSFECHRRNWREPTWLVYSDRRGGRTAWSASVTVEGQVIPARLWYDGGYINSAKEEASEIAIRTIQVQSPVPTVVQTVVQPLQQQQYQSQYQPQYQTLSSSSYQPRYQPTLHSPLQSPLLSQQQQQQQLPPQQQVFTHYHQPSNPRAARTQQPWRRGGVK